RWAPINASRALHLERSVSLGTARESPRAVNATNESDCSKGRASASLVALILLVDMFGNSSGTADANASAEQTASRAVAVQTFHGFSPISRRPAAAQPALIQVGCSPPG